MTTTEFNDRFEILFNKTASNGAPPLDLYEKSVYLTKAQLQLVKNYFDPLSNRKGKGFEKSEKRRRDLSELVRPYRTTLKINSESGLDDNSQFFRIPSNTFMIIQEKAKVSSSDQCVNGKYIKVVPRTHDEYLIQIDNPFKKPNDEVIWRFDFYSQSGSTKNVELISPYRIDEYVNRYIIYPEPIVLTDLLSAFPNETLTIDGVSQEQTCKLNQEIHPEILDRAVELALADYKPENLQVKAQMNLRNE